MVMGAHAAGASALPVRAPSSSSLLFPIWSTLLVFLLCGWGSGGHAIIAATAAAAASVPDALLKFKESLTNANVALASWNPTSSKPCNGDYANWIGVLCVNGKVWGLQLENMDLGGDIDIDSLALLPDLRTLSFMNNNFDGPLPSFNKLGSLKNLYLSHNQFFGKIPDDAFSGMGSLKKLYLSDNEFTGAIPTSISALPKLLDARLEGNRFSGRIPDFGKQEIKTLNVSNNQLEGPIPPSLINLAPSLFAGNKDLCGKPLDAVCRPRATTSPPSDSDNPNAKQRAEPPSNSSQSALKIVIIVICCLLALALIALLLLIYRRSKESTPQLGRSGSPYGDSIVINNHHHHHYHHRGGSTHLSPVDGSRQVRLDQAKKGEASTQGNGGGVGGKLSFVRDDRQRFELADLLRASAEVLGSGNFGSSYKALLMDGQAVVVKRFKHMNSVGREEFQEHMRRLGRLSHPNLLPLVAYYYRKEEKLLVFDHIQNGSLASHLHGNHTADHPGLDWPTRLKIVKGVGRGLLYLHNDLPSLIVPHGHLKSSNVLLDKSFNPLLMDYTLLPVVNLEHAQQIMVAYKSPEYTHFGRTTKKTDVWSFGILILEVITGKFPANYLPQGIGSDLQSWVDSIANPERVAFDREMGNTKNGEGQMLKLFKIGLACCEEDVGTRLDLKEAVEEIEALDAWDDGAGGFDDVIVV